MLKVLLKQRRHFFKLFFIYEHVNIFIAVIVYISVLKTLPSFMLSLQKKSLFSLFSLLNVLFKKIHKHPAYKMNSDEQGGAGRKFEVLNEHTF